MKRCPTCQSTYTDDSLRFCLQDGATLLTVSGSGPTIPDAGKTMRMESTGRPDDPPPTEILNPSVLPTMYAAKSPLTAPQQSRPTETGAHQEFISTRTTTRNNALIPITIAATVLLLAVGGLGAWLLFGNKNNNAPRSVRTGADRTTAQPTASPSPAPSPTTATTPTPAASPSPVNTAAVQSEVTALLNGWADSSMARDIESHMSYYADTLDVYYNKTNTSASAVRSDRKRAYATYQTLDIRLSDIRITPDATGERATAVFDKTWSFEGEDKATSGSVQQELRLAKIDGRWRITAERDLQVYYVNR
ncbi:MAG TPA: hypothetical protein VGX92_05070 [Pyrinomonadaceae bacterium]|jgi:ketosteroid isomerase-like protein|nr:hypothetical protein [Pyrinomonadaceae bacterium]